MASRQDKDREGSKDRAAGRSEAVRSAVDQAFQATSAQAHSAASATAGARDRAQDLVDELAQAAGRVRDALDDLRPPTADEIRALRADLGALEKRVEALERKGSRRSTGTRSKRSS